MPRARGRVVGVEGIDAVVLGGHDQDVVDRAVAHGHLADLQGLGIDLAVDRVMEEPPEARRVDVLRRQRRLVQVGAGYGIVVVIREDVCASVPGATGVSEPNRPCVSSIEAGGEVDGVGVAAVAAVADLQRPQPVDLNRLAVGVLQLAQEVAGGGVEGVDAAVAEVAHSSRVAGARPPKLAGAMASPHGESSGAARDQAHLAAGQARRAVQVEDVDEAVAGPGHVVVLVGVLLGVGDVDLAAEDLDVERGVALGQVRVGERARRQRDGLEVRSKTSICAGAEVGGVEQGRAVGVAGDDRRRCRWRWPGPCRPPRFAGRGRGS